MKIVFLGTPDFAVPVLNKLIEAGHEVGFVVTQPDRKGNRGKVIFSPVKQAALDNSIEVLQPEHISKDESILAKLEGFAPDAMIVIAYGQILRRNVIDIPRLGCFNVHASLLPRLRGASPIQHAILDGDERAGVTIMKIDEGLDTGDMVISDSVEIGRMNFEELHDTLSVMGADLMVRALELIESGKAEFTPQDDSQSTYAGMIRKEDGKIDFTDSATAIDQKIRAFDPWPGAFCDFGGTTIKIWKAEPEEKEYDGIAPGTVLSTDSSIAPGTVLSADSSGIRVKCGKGVLIIEELQLPGKKRTSVRDYLLGHKIEAGMRFE
ncbi:MAG: methionyl-tRNA formyltransferase [Eubacterium sp.]|nr:methionyl-tRNA formyltransferase [Eubacterium sp.]